MLPSECVLISLRGESGTIKTRTSESTYIFKALLVIHKYHPRNVINPICPDPNAYLLSAEFRHQTAFPFNPPSINAYRDAES